MILDIVRARGEIALACASTGIASMLLEGGATLHSTCKLPFPKVNVNDFCGIEKGDNARCKLLQQARLMTLDEASMQNKNVINCIDRSLRDLRDEPDIPFGGMVFVIFEIFSQF